jgi:hypothetical protein
MRTAMTSMKTLAIIALATATIAAPASVASAQAPPPDVCGGYSGLPEAAIDKSWKPGDIEKVK